MNIRSRSIFSALIVLAVGSCARTQPAPPPREPAHALEPEAARAAARRTADPVRAVDLAWLEGNDRALARELLDRAIDAKKDPALLLRRALLSQMELDDPSTRRDLIAILESAPESPEAEAAAVLLYDEIEDGANVKKEIALAADRSPVLSAPSASPSLVALLTLIRARVAGPREEGPWITRGGWLTKFQSLGPLGPRMQATLRTTTAHETEGLKPGAKYHSLEPPIRSPPMRWLEVSPALGDVDGLYVGETYVRIAKADWVALTVHLRTPGRVRVDGATVFERDVDDLSVRRETIRLRLPAGWHRVAFGMLAASGDGIRLSMLGERGQQVIEEQRTEPPNGVHFGEAPKELPDESEGFDEAVDFQLGDLNREIGARIVGSAVALSRQGRDLERARALLRPLSAYAPKSAVREALEARLATAEGLPASLSQASLRRAIAQDPTLPRALLMIARALESDSPDQALELVDRARAAAPTSPDPEVVRFRILRSRRWNTEAEDSLRSALAKRDSRELLLDGARFYRQLYRIKEAEELEARAQKISASESAIRAASIAISKGDLDSAVSLLAEGAPLAARPEEVWARIAELELGRKRPERALEPIEKALEIDPYFGKALRLSAVALSAVGKTPAALEQLELLRKIGVADFDLEISAARAQGLEPGQLPDGSWLKGELTADPSSLARAAPDPRWSGDKRVKLIERIIDWVRADGYSLSLSHSLVRLQTKEATDMAGEFQLPGGALALAMRTLKADGRVLEVDRHEGKEDLSFSGLAPGDTVEQKWIAFNSPQSGFGGYVRRFFFQTDVPTDRAELAVVVPKGLSVWWHAYNGAPEPKIHEEKDQTVYLFRAEDVPGLPVEPSVAPYEEFLPFVVVAAGFDPALALETNVMPLVSIARPSWDVRELATVIANGARSDEEKVMRVYQWVTSSVRHGDFAPPSVVLGTRRGDRTGLIAAMLRAIDVDARVVLARPGFAAQVEPIYPDQDRFGSLLVRVDLTGSEKKRLWIRASGAATWIGQAPPELRGGSYVSLPSLDRPPEIERFSGREIAVWQVQSNVSLEVNEEGHAKGIISLTLPGQLGQNVRHGLRPLRVEERGRAVQGWLNGIIPGTRLAALELTNLEDEGADFQFKAQVLIPSLLHLEQGRLVSNRFFGEPIGVRAVGARPLEAYIRLSQRKMPLFVPEARERLEVTIRLPQSVGEPTEAPPSFEKKTPFAHVEQRFHFDPKEKRIDLTLIEDVPASRVPSKAFPEFVELVQEIALRTRNRLVIPIGAR
jgi:cellulose synthase operon protein C